MCRLLVGSVAALVLVLVAIVGVYSAGYQNGRSFGRLRAGPLAPAAQSTGEANGGVKYESQAITPDAAKKAGSRCDPTYRVLVNRC